MADVIARLKNIQRHENIIVATASPHHIAPSISENKGEKIDRVGRIDPVITCQVHPLGVDVVPLMHHQDVRIGLSPVAHHIFPVVWTRALRGDEAGMHVNWAVEIEQGRVALGGIVHDRDRIVHPDPGRLNADLRLCQCQKTAEK